MAGGEASAKTSGGLVRGLQEAFAEYTIQDGLSVGDIVAMDFILLGDASADGSVVVLTLADTGETVVVTVNGTKIADIRLGEHPSPMVGLNACS